MDRIIAMAAALLDAPIAAVAMSIGGVRVLRSMRGNMVTDRSGEHCGDIPLEMGPDGALVILDLASYPATSGNSFVQGPAGCRFYAGVAIKDRNGARIGSLCVLDVVDRTYPSPDVLRLLHMLADQAASAVAQINMAQAQAEKVELLGLAESLLGLGHWRLDYLTGKVTWSEEVYRIHGLDPSTFDPSLDDALSAYHPDDQAMIAEYVERGRATGQGFECQLRITRPDGAVRLTQSTGRCILDDQGRSVALFGVFQDITDRDAGERRLRDSEERYRLLAENASDMIATFRPNGEITFISPAVRLILGFEPEELVGKKMIELTHPDDRSLMLDHYKALFSKGVGATTDPYHFRTQRKDGAWVWLEGQPKVFFDDKTGLPLQILDVARDVTKRKEMEIALSEARHAAEAATVSKAKFLATMSHEIRTPLNGVLGFTDLLTKTSLNDDQYLYVRRIRTAGRGLSALIDDILDFSRIEAGSLPIQKHVFNLQDMLEEVVDLVKRGSAQKPVAVTSRVHGDIGQRLLGDDTRIRQVLLNLVGNAAKFTEVGSVELSASVEDGRLVLKVSDTGPGIPASDLQKVFEGFNQGDGSITRRFGGSGLGLSISRSLAELMGGELTLESEVGLGTTAIFILPYEEAANKPELAPLHPRRKHGSSGLRIMIVDDGAFNRELAEIALHQRGYSSTAFADAGSAIAALERGDPFDVILMDVQMPDIDGLEATRRIRRLQGASAHLPIIAVTAGVMPDQLAACRAAGMDNHVAKPVDFDLLTAVIDRMLSQQEAAASSIPVPTDAAGSNGLEQLTAAYRKHLGSLPRKLGRLARQGRSEQIAQVAHTIAGTAGSLGFPEVSHAAFALEATVKAVPMPHDASPDLVAATGRLSAAIRRCLSVEMAA